MTILSETRDEYRARRFGFFRRRAREKKIKRSAHLFSRSLSPIRAAGSPSRVRPIGQAWSRDARVAAETLDVITRRHVLLCFVRAVFRARALETPLALKTHVPRKYTSDKSATDRRRPFSVPDSSAAPPRARTHNAARRRSRRRVWLRAARARWGVGRAAIGPGSRRMRRRRGGRRRHLRRRRNLPRRPRRRRFSRRRRALPRAPAASRRTASAPRTPL